MKSFPGAKLFLSQQRHGLFFFFKFCNPTDKGVSPIEVFDFEITVYRDVGLIVNSLTCISFLKALLTVYVESPASLH